MKKLFMIIILSAAMSCMSTICHAVSVKLDISVHFDDPYEPHPIPRTPTLLPDIYIDGNTLSFANLWGSYVLQFIQDGTIVYSTCVSSGTTSVILPSTLTGDYEFRLVADTYYYYGYIEL